MEARHSSSCPISQTFSCPSATPARTMELTYALENASDMLPHRDARAASKTRSWVLALRVSVRKESSSSSKSSNIGNVASFQAFEASIGSVR